MVVNQDEFISFIFSIFNVNKIIDINIAIIKYSKNNCGSWSFDEYRYSAD
jgi:hypothetical protein